MVRKRISHEISVERIAPRRSLLAAALGVAFAGVVPVAHGGPFPAVFPLASLYPAGGGDGSRGFVLTGIDDGDQAGGSVSAAGDVNGDGVDDLILGARYADSGGDSQAGEGYVVFGSTLGFPAVVPLASLSPAGGGDGTRGFVLTGLDEFDRSGYSVSGTGDVNADGLDDLIINSDDAAPGGDHDRRVGYIVYGSTRGFPAVVPLGSLYPAGGGDGTRGFVLTGIDESTRLGTAVSGAGDVNGDGVDDFIIGADDADPGGDSDAGGSYVVFGSPTGFPAIMPLATLYPAGSGDGTRGFVLTGIDANDNAGEAVSAAGDVNGDGVDDVIIGADDGDPGADFGAGESYVVFGSTSGFPPVLPLATLYPAGGGDGTRGFVLTGIDEGDQAGQSVSAAGDVNGDGVDDLIVSAHYADPGGDVVAGESYVVFGSSSGFPAIVPLASLRPSGGGDGSRGFVLTGIDAHDASGVRVSEAGDVNGDGVDDLIIGANNADPRGDSSAGESYVVFGSSAGFPAVVPLASLYPAGGGDGTRGFVLTGVERVDYSGISVSAAGDVNDDGVDDLIVGARSGNGTTGAAYVVFGRRAAQ